VKTYAVVEPTVAARNAIRKRTSRALGKSQRDCITLSDPTDCLLEAYDCVARRAYEHFLARGPRPGGELADWLRAERELLLGFTINVQDSAEFVYALASIPGATAARLEVGIESRWLVILAQDSRPAHVVRDEVVSGVTRSFDLGLAISRGKPPGAGSGRHEEPCLDDERAPSKSVCVLELPATVDAARSIAILSDGLLAIRMPKFTPRH
jgi:HSP20 family molecular chaperone IbpA